MAPWAPARIAHLAALSTDGGSADGAAGAGEGRVYDFHGMTAVSSGQKLARILAGRDMVEAARPVVNSASAVPDSAPGAGAPLASPSVIKPVSFQTGPGDRSMTPEEQAAANQARRDEQTQFSPVPGGNQPSRGVNQPAQGVPAPPANNTVPQQNAPQVQPVQNPQPAPGNPAPGTDKPAPASALPAEGVPWETKADNGAVATSVIVPGTGGQTIDTTIRNADGTTTQMRSVSNGQGGVTTWTANADGSYSVRYPDGTEGAEGGRAKIYTVPAGMNPSGPAPMQADISADGTRVETPSFDADGNRIGTDVGVLNEQGLYNNYHHDNYGNVLITQAVSNGKGGVDSTIIGGIDSDGSRWHLDKAGNRWSISDDGQGNTYLSRTVQAKDGVHWLHTNKAGLVVDEYRGRGTDWYADTYNADGTRTRRYADKSETIFDAAGKTIGHNKAPDDRMWWEKIGGGAIRGGTVFGSAIVDVLAYPFRKVADGMTGMSSMQVNQSGVIVTYQPPDREARLAEIGGAFVRPVVGSVEYLAGNLTDFMATASSIRVGPDGIGSTYQRPDRENTLVGDLIGVTPKEMKENPWESAGLLGFNVAMNAGGLRFGRGARVPKVEEPIVVDQWVDYRWGESWDVESGPRAGAWLYGIDEATEFGGFRPLVEMPRLGDIPEFGAAPGFFGFADGASYFGHPVIEIPPLRAGEFSGPHRIRDFNDLIEDSILLRAEGVEDARGLPPLPKKERRPEERALTTGRWRSDEYPDAPRDLYNFSGWQHDWSPANKAPQRPPAGERVYETSRASSYDPETGTWRASQGSDRRHDSEPKFFEELIRAQLAQRSGLQLSEVNSIIHESAELVELFATHDPNLSSPGLMGVRERTAARIEMAIYEANSRAAAKYGSSYKPFTSADISGDLRLVIDLPAARQINMPPAYQVCRSCEQLMDVYQAVFRNVRIEAVNLKGERVYPL